MRHRSNQPLVSVVVPAYGRPEYPLLAVSLGGERTVDAVRRLKRLGERIRGRREFRTSGSETNA